MNTKKLYLISTLLFTPVFTVSAAIDFTKEELDLVKKACLAGSSFDFITEADGSISVKNLEGKGKLHISKKNVDTVDLPDPDKKEEFREIRSCIKDYLLKDNQGAMPKQSQLPSGFSVDDEGFVLRPNGQRICQHIAYAPPPPIVTYGRNGSVATSQVGAGGHIECKLYDGTWSQVIMINSKNGLQPNH